MLIKEEVAVVLPKQLIENNLVVQRQISTAIVWHRSINDVKGDCVGTSTAFIIKLS